MKKSVFLIALFVNILPFQSIFSQDFKKDALKEFRLQHYNEAISLLNKALEKDSGDAELFYYLGYFTHYLAYDSRPIDNYKLIEHSDKVLDYLEKAVKINPKHGDALYFLGAEHGVRFLHWIRKNELSKAINELSIGKQKGCYPDWLLEYAGNILKSCEENAILFLDGDAPFNCTNYLQLVKNIRKDITAIPISLLERTWYLQILKNGIPDYIGSFPIGWDDYQIIDVHSYKWDTTMVKIPICDEVKKKYSLKEGNISVRVSPDLNKAETKYLGVKSAAILNILITNGFKRPVYFLHALGNEPCLGLSNFLQNNGLVYKVLPFDVTETGEDLNIETIEKVYLDENNYFSLPDLGIQQMPRIQNMMSNYYVPFINLINYYTQKNNFTKADNLIKLMEKYILVSIVEKPDFVNRTISDYREKRLKANGIK